MNSKRMIKRFLGILPILVFIICLFLWLFAPAHGERYICFRCWKEKRILWVAGERLIYFKECDLSKWHAQAFPDHIHKWELAGRWHGTMSSRMVGSRGALIPFVNPIITLPRGQQKNFLERASLEQLLRFDELMMTDRRGAVEYVRDFLFNVPDAPILVMPGPDGVWSKKPSAIENDRIETVPGP